MRKKILYERKLYDIDEEEFDHYHLKGNHVIIKKNEVIRIPFTNVLYSKYSEKKILKKLNKSINSFYKKLQKMYRSLA